jgi:hypothetical protein
MHLQLYARGKDQDVYERGLEGCWEAMNRRAAQEVAHRLQCAGKLAGGGKATLTRTPEWLDSTKNLRLRMLQHIHVTVADEAGEVVGRERIPATELIHDLAETTISNMATHQQVQAEDQVVYYLAGFPEEEPVGEDTYRLPPCVDVRERPELAGSLQEAMDAQRCEGCKKTVCEHRSVVIAQDVLDSIVAWHEDHSTGGVEVGGVLLGHVLQHAPGGAEVLVTGHIPVLDENATVIRWQITAEAWMTVLDELAARKAVGDPDLVMCGSYHSHDLQAIAQTAGEAETEVSEDGKVLLPSPNDRTLWDINFRSPHMVNAILSAQTHELTCYRWRRAQPRYTLPLYVQCAVMHAEC